MFIEKGTFETKRLLRYETLATATEINQILFVLHGYGHLVEYFIKKFEGLDLKNCLIIAPEGMHRFYLNGTNGRVGASWMTKEWREQDIVENIQTLDQLAFHFQSKYPNATISILGFSQGGATAARWINKGKINCTHFISWGSVFPPDLDINFLNKLSMTKTFVVGKNDPFFPEKELKNCIEKHQEMGFECITFEGKHDISISTLNKILKQ